MAGNRLVACDVDGTLLRDDGSVSRATRRTLDRLRLAGWGFVLATGRPVRTLRPVLRQTGTTGIVVCVNGAACYDPIQDRVLARATIPPPVLRETIDILRRLLPGALFAAEVDGGRWWVCEPAYPLHGPTPRARRARLMALVHEPVCKFVAKVGEEDPQLLFDAVASALDGLVEVAPTACAGVLEMTVSGVTKASALGEVAAAAGILGTDVVAFGDMPNDLPMLAWAGVGVAVANAHPTVLAGAARVTASNNEDGVAHYLDVLLDAEGAGRCGSW